ncbi:hypothetical protein KBY58_02250 [Cyanobium sp. HWJ4-Hawea]|nr:hypothetical protein [Cyanobium sp. HWJ4-Hawea]
MALIRFLALTFIIAITFPISNAFSADKSNPHQIIQNKTDDLAEAIKLIKAGSPQNALNLLDSADPRYQKDNDYYYFIRARALQELKRDLDAFENYTISIYINPKSHKAFVNRGLTKGALRQLDGAIEDFTKSIQIKNDNPVAYLNRGVTYAGMNDLPKALLDFDRALKYDKNYIDAYRNRGITLFYTKQNKLACQDWRKAVSLGANDIKQWIVAYCKSK